MAHFIGKLNGARGPASRLGTKNSGMEVIAASWNGAVKTTLYHNASDGRDYAQVALIPWHGKGVSRILYDGPVDKPADAPSPFNGLDVKRADVNKYADEQAERHEAEKLHEQGVMYGDPVSADHIGSFLLHQGTFVLHAFIQKL